MSKMLQNGLELLLVEQIQWRYNRNAVFSKRNPQGNDSWAAIDVNPFVVVAGTGSNYGAGEQLLGFDDKSITNILYTDACEDITSWTNNDIGDGLSSQGAFDGKECFILNSGSAGAGNNANISLNLGDQFKDRLLFELKFNSSLLGQINSGDEIALIINLTSTLIFHLKLCTDGLYLLTATGNQRIGTTEVIQQSQWNKLVGTLDFQNILDAFCSFTLNEDFIGAAPINLTGIVTPGQISLYNPGLTTSNLITNIDYLKFYKNAEIKNSSYKINKLVITGSDHATPYKIRLAWSDVDLADAISNNQYVEFMVQNNGGSVENVVSNPIIINEQTRVWAQCKNVNNGSSVSLLVGLKEV